MEKYTRQKPFPSYIRERELITKDSSTRKTYHIVLDVRDWQQHYKVGDSIAVLPSNNIHEVESILQKVRASGKESVLSPITKKEISFREFLTCQANLSKVNRSFAKNALQESFLFSEDHRQELSEYLQNHTMLDVLKEGKMTIEQIVQFAMPLLPRFYSIANSIKVFPDEVHLLVSYVQYACNGQVRLGVGSHFLCHEAIVGKTIVPIYVQHSNHFTLPEDSSQSIIMVGSGTGIAPYRGFIQDRLALQSAGRSWLFFGERNRKTDFYYEPFWLDLEKQGRIRLSLAFSRDHQEKYYVHHKMYEERKSLWQWLKEGSYFYVCGDAEKMAKDVDMMLHQIIREEGNFSEEETKQYIREMRKKRKYLVDVY